MKNIYIYGGSFDPIHNVHLKIAKHFATKENSVVLFSVAKAPRWKQPSETASDRLNMLKLGLKEANIENYIIDKYELNSKSDVNYTIDTLKHIIKTYGEDNKYYLIIGGDQVNKFDDWKSANEISKLSQIIYVKRKGIKLDKSLVKKYKMIDSGLVVDGTSSTAIRELKSLDIPESVLRYIEEHNLYFIKTVKDYLIEKRFIHSLSVAKLAYEIAKSNHIKNYDEFYIAGLLHDIGKYIPEKNTMTIINSHYKKEARDLSLKAYHQFVGEYIALKDFGITNKAILCAIRYHCSGSRNMSKMAKVIYAADKIDPNRGYDSKYMIDACMKDIDTGFELVLSENIKHLQSKGLDYNNHLTKACVNRYLKERN